MYTSSEYSKNFLKNLHFLHKQEANYVCRLQFALFVTPIVIKEV